MNLANTDAAANLAVKDIGRARRFYEEVLGLEAAGQEGEDFVTYKTGSSTVNVYVSDYAGTNKATAVTWQVGDVDQAVRELKAKGVAFEHYQMPGMHQEGDVHVADDGAMRLAWFKDPDGNILHLAS